MKGRLIQVVVQLAAAADLRPRAFGQSRCRGVAVAAGRRGPMASAWDTLARCPASQPRPTPPVPPPTTASPRACFEGVVHLHGAEGVGDNAARHQSAGAAAGRHSNRSICVANPHRRSGIGTDSVADTDSFRAVTACWLPAPWLGPSRQVASTTIAKSHRAAEGCGRPVPNDLEGPDPLVVGNAYPLVRLAGLAGVVSALSPRQVSSPNACAVTLR